MEPIPRPPENEAPVEIEQKYLLQSDQDIKNLAVKVKTVYPEAEYLGGYREESYFYPKISKEKARQLLSLVANMHDVSTQLSMLESVPDDTPIAIRFRKRKNREYMGFKLTLKASANPLHDVERIEIETGDVSRRYMDGFAAHGMRPETEWFSDRRIFQIDDDTTVDMQDVTGYGYTAEVESSSLEKVQSIAHSLGLQPISSNLLDAMYSKYKEKWQKYTEGEHERHFSDEDWQDIERLSGERVVRNQVS